MYISLQNIKNSNGPSVLPWGVPYVMGKSFDMQGVELDAVTHLTLSFLFSR